MLPRNAHCQSSLPHLKFHMSNGKIQTMVSFILLISLKTNGESLLPLRHVNRALRKVVQVLAIIVPVSTSF